jgi:hypothetical protein
VASAKDSSVSANRQESLRFQRAIRKWERLSEELQSTMVDPTSTESSSPLFRKRRLDVAITISELHQRQRRRIIPSDDGDIMPMSNGAEDPRGKLETAILNFLRGYSLGTRVDDHMLDSMLPNGLGGDHTTMVGKLLITQPLTIKALLGYMFKSGTQRVASTVTKNKCARLISLSVLAAEEEAINEGKVDASLKSEYDEVALSRMLSEGSQLCETLENMVSFLVTTDAGKKGATPGQQLCTLALKCTSLAQGVCLWARDLTRGNEFVTSASYPTLSPSILSLVRLVSMHHAFTRRDVIELALGFLKHSNSEISYQKMNEIKEQALRLLLFLAIKGEAPTVCGRMTDILKHPGSSCMDASLIRYFVSGLLEVIRGPFSVPFVRSVGALLMTPTCSEAVRSQYFGDENRQRMTTLLNSLKEILAERSEKGSLTPGDAALVKSVVSTFSS